jgi:hypothetical protein
VLTWLLVILGPSKGTLKSTLRDEASELGPLNRGEPSAHLMRTFLPERATSLMESLDERDTGETRE